MSGFFGRRDRAAAPGPIPAPTAAADTYQERVATAAAGFQHFVEQGGDPAVVQRLMHVVFFTCNLASLKVFIQRLKERVRALPVKTAQSVTRVLEDMADSTHSLFQLATGSRAMLSAAACTAARKEVKSAQAAAIFHCTVKVKANVGDVLAELKLMEATCERQRSEAIMRSKPICLPELLHSLQGMPGAPQPCKEVQEYIDSDDFPTSAEHLLDPSGPHYQLSVKTCTYIATAVVPLVQYTNDTYGTFLRPPVDADLEPMEFSRRMSLATSYKLLRDAESVCKALGKCMEMPEHLELLRVMQHDFCPVMLGGFEAEMAAGGGHLEQMLTAAIARKGMEQAQAAQQLAQQAVHDAAGALASSDMLAGAVLDLQQAMGQQKQELERRLEQQEQQLLQSQRKISRLEAAQGVHALGALQYDEALDAENSPIFKRRVEHAPQPEPFSKQRRTILQPMDMDSDGSPSTAMRTVFGQAAAVPSVRAAPAVHAVQQQQEQGYQAGRQKCKTQQGQVADAPAFTFQPHPMSQH